MNGGQSGSFWSAVGQAITIFVNYLITVFIALLGAAVHLPPLPVPSAEFLGAEQMLVGLLFGAWAEKEKIAVPNDPGSPLKAPSVAPAAAVTALALFLSAVALSACSVQPAPRSPQQAVYEVKGDYAAALSVAVQYRQLTPCTTPSAPVVCSDSNVVDKLQKADDVASALIDNAEKTVRDPSASAGLVTAAVSGAQNAVAAFQSIAATLKIK